MPLCKRAQCSEQALVRLRRVVVHQHEVARRGFAIVAPREQLAVERKTGFDVTAIDHRGRTDLDRLPLAGLQRLCARRPRQRFARPSEPVQCSGERDSGAIVVWMPLGAGAQQLDIRVRARPRRRNRRASRRRPTRRRAASNVARRRAQRPRRRDEDGNARAHAVPRWHPDAPQPGLAAHRVLRAKRPPARGAMPSRAAVRSDPTCAHDNRSRRAMANATTDRPSRASRTAPLPFPCANPRATRALRSCARRSRRTAARAGPPRARRSQCLRRASRRRRASISPSVRRVAAASGWSPVPTRPS